MRLALALVLLLTAPALAEAQTRTLVAPAGDKWVIVWKNDKARSEGDALLAANVDTRLILPLVACAVTPGTQAVKTDGGVFTSDILITSGKHSGCRGNIANGHLGKR